MDKLIDRIYNKLQYLIPSLYSLAVFRIILGISILYNLIIIRLPYVKEFYGKNTLIPKSMMIEMNGVNSFSMLNLIQSDGFAYIFIWVTILATIFFTIGYKTKIAGFISLFGFWSLLQASSIFVVGYDSYTFQVLFWAVFLPLNSYFSFDRNKTKKNITPSLTVSIVLLVQISCVYFFAGISKDGITWKNGTAITALLLDMYSTTPLQKYMINQKLLCKFLTYITLIFQILSPIFIFIKSRNNYLRYIIVILIFGFHLSILLLTNVGNFSITGIAVAIFLLPNSFWERIKFVKYEKILHNRDTFGKYFKYGYLLLCLFSIYIILEKNIFYSTKHTLSKYHKSSQWVVENLDFLDIPSPITISVFYQYWELFSPNPPFILGWFTIEEKKIDGTFVDIFTNRRVDVANINFKYAWHPKGMEHFLLYLSRFYMQPQRGEKYRIYLFYWIINKLQAHGVTSKLDYRNYYLVNYIYKINLENLEEKPTYKRDIKSCSKIIYGVE